MARIGSFEAFRTKGKPRSSEGTGTGVAATTPGVPDVSCRKASGSTASFTTGTARSELPWLTTASPVNRTSENRNRMVMLLTVAAGDPVLGHGTGSFRWQRREGPQQTPPYLP